MGVKQYIARYGFIPTRIRTRVGNDSESIEDS